MMTSMIERVARAIVEADCNAEGLTFKELSRHMARAAIEAMREPTNAMQVAFDECHAKPYHPSSKYRCAHTLSAMIDAALTGKE